MAYIDFECKLQTLVTRCEINCRILDSINSIVTFTIRFPNKFKAMSELQAAKRDCEFE